MGALRAEQLLLLRDIVHHLVESQSQCPQLIAAAHPGVGVKIPFGEASRRAGDKIQSPRQGIAHDQADDQYYAHADYGDGDTEIARFAVGGHQGFIGKFYGQQSQVAGATDHGLAAPIAIRAIG